MWFYQIGCVISNLVCLISLLDEHEEIRGNKMEIENACPEIIQSFEDVDTVSADIYKGYWIIFKENKKATDENYRYYSAIFTPSGTELAFCPAGKNLRTVANSSVVWINGSKRES